MAETPALPSAACCLQLQHALLEQTPGSGRLAAQVVPLGNHVESLSAGERQHIAPMAEPRLLSFSSGRRAAHLALAELGAEVDTLDRLDTGDADWPLPLRGSISHHEQVAIALVGEFTAARWWDIGVDIEAVRPLDDSVWSMIASPRDAQVECAHLDWYRMAVFSLKEALYKAIHSRCQRFVDFHEVALEAPEQLAQAMRQAMLAAGAEGNEQSAAHGSGESLPVYARPEPLVSVAASLEAANDTLGEQLSGVSLDARLYYWQGALVSRVFARQAGVV